MEAENLHNQVTSLSLKREKIVSKIAIVMEINMDIQALVTNNREGNKTSL